MSIISTTIPNLINGVSQQPFSLRLASQSEEQVNGYSSVVDGLRKRPPSRHVAKILNTPTDGGFIHTINRDAAERYEIIVTNGNLRVFKLTGEEVTVNFPNGKAYLNTPTPQADISAVTVADYTFLVNKTVTVAESPAVAPARPFEALFWVRQGAYSTTYNISINGQSFSHTTTAANSAADGAAITTDNIAAQLYTKINAQLPGAGFTVGVVGGLIYVSHPTNDFQVLVTDGIGDNGLKAIRGTIQRFSDLPAKGWPGFKVRVQGTNENAFDEYFVEHLSEPQNAYGGVWKETVKGGETFSLNNATMPHALIRQANGTFTFQPMSWETRKVGSKASIPMPSFVGKKLADIYFHRNRLGLLAEENVIFSRAGEFFNFFPESAIQSLDTDPIDVAVSHVKVSNLRHAIPFNESLLLFSDQTQFILGKSELLTPRTISINQTTEFECSLRAKPVGAGQNVYFATQRGAFTGIREYFVNGDTEQNDAAEVTAHCPRYLPKGVVKLAASSNEDVLVALSEQTPNSLYVYRYYWNGNDKLQSAWSRWDFGSDTKVLNCDFIESDLWCLVSRPDGTYIEVISLEPGRVDEGATFQVHLDRRLAETQVTSRTYDAPTNTTSIILPYATYTDTVEFVAWFGNATLKAGQKLPYTTAVDGQGRTVYRLSGDVTKFFVGVRYALRYRFSTLIIREEAAGGGGQQPIGEGRMQLRRMALTYNDSGYFRVEVTPYNRDTYSYVFGGRVVGSGRNKIGDVAIETGIFRFPIMSKNDQVQIDIVNDTPFPCAFLSAEWEGFFQIRSRRL